MRVNGLSFDQPAASHRIAMTPGNHKGCPYN